MTNEPRARACAAYLQRSMVHFGSRRPPCTGCQQMSGIAMRAGVGQAGGMRFYMLPGDDGTTTCVNFDHVAYIHVSAKSIELFFMGVEEPMVITKTPTSLALIAKGMDLSDNSKDLINAL